MSRNWRVYNQEGLHFVSFSTVGWIDVFTRRLYKDILVESLKYCQKEKGLELYGWCIMTNHVHLLARAKEGNRLSDILRDFKRHTSKEVLQAIQDNPAQQSFDLSGAGALIYLGLGYNVSLKNVTAGDLITGAILNLEYGTGGHSVIFLNYIKEDGVITGFEYWETYGLGFSTFNDPDAWKIRKAANLEP